MSSFKESLRQAMEQSEREFQKNPEKVIKVKTTPKGYLIISSTILTCIFLLLVLFGPQTILSNDYVTVKGVFQGEDLVYSAGDQLIVHENVRDYGYYYVKGSRTKSASNGRRFQWQVISYKKENPEEFEFAFGLHGNLSDLSHPTLHHFILFALVLLAILNLFFFRWASSKKAKKLVENMPPEKDS